MSPINNNGTQYTVPPNPGRWRALTLAAAFHLGLFLLLWLGVLWKSERPIAAEAKTVHPNRQAQPRSERAPEFTPAAKPVLPTPAKFPGALDTPALAAPSPERRSGKKNVDRDKQAGAAAHNEQQKQTARGKAAALAEKQADKQVRERAKERATAVVARSFEIAQGQRAAKFKMEREKQADSVKRKAHIKYEKQSAGKAKEQFKKHSPNKANEAANQLAKNTARRFKASTKAFASKRKLADQLAKKKIATNEDKERGQAHEIEMRRITGSVSQR